MEGNLYLAIIYGGYFLSTVILSFLINGLFLKFVSTLGIRNAAETVIRWSPTSRPSLGGISFYLIFLISVASYSIFFEQSHVFFNKQLLGLLAACTLAFLLGLSDDAYNTRPMLKFIIQICCAVILISTGTFISVFHSEILNYGLTILWVVGLMNSINMLDNMDAITSVVSIMIILNTLMILFLSHDSDNINIMLLIGALSAITGFLFFNWHPAKMFMGDTGSQFLGIFLAAIGILYFWNSPGSGGPSPVSRQICITAIAFAIPIIDTTSVVINRIRKGHSPFVGGLDHTTHCFFYQGLTEKRIAFMYAGISLISIIMTFIIIKFIDDWNYVHVILFTIYFFALFRFLYLPTLRQSR